MQVIVDEAHRIKNDQTLLAISLRHMQCANKLLLTGTPAGIGNAREPQVFLKEGDEVITRSDKLGELRNTLAYRELS